MIYGKGQEVGIRAQFSGAQLNEENCPFNDSALPWPIELN